MAANEGIRSSLSTQPVPNFPKSFTLKQSKEKKIAESWDYCHASASSRIPQSKAKKNAWKPNKDGRRSSPRRVGAETARAAASPFPALGWPRSLADTGSVRQAADC